MKIEMNNCKLIEPVINEEFVFITPSEVIEYLYCPRFIYYMKVLNIHQHEQRRKLVNKGRDIHNLKLVLNKEYLRNRIGVVDKQQEVYLTSRKMHLVGKVDEVLFLKDGKAAPLDYKFAFWDERIYKTLKIQQTLYALMIEENYDQVVEKAYLVYVRSKNKLVELEVTDKLKTEAKKIIRDMFEVIELNYFPKSTKVKSKCNDCTYRNLCGI